AGHRKQIARTAVLTAFIASVLFAVAGKMLLDFLGLSIWDFSISGGILLLVLSISDLLKSIGQSAGSTLS
ncbi:multiple antibiotic resistance protein (MarC), partial [mine drainage metagenome]